MKLMVPDWNAPPAIGACATTRGGGVSAGPYDDGVGGGGLNLGLHVGDRAGDVERNRALLRAALPAQPVWLSQVHGVNVVDAADAAGSAEVPVGDASVSATPGIVCAIQTADCLPVLFCDVAGRVVGAAHAGWRGLVAGVLENTVAAMRAKGAHDIIAWLGPAIGPDRFEVGQEVLDAFVAHERAAEAAFRPQPGQDGKFLADIYLLARQRLAGAGVTRCFGGGLCTVSDAQRFYSYRRDRITGRMASLIWLN
jgi:YfiH family protein